MLAAACLMIRVAIYDVSDAALFTLLNRVADNLKQCGRPLRWIEHGLDNALEIASFTTPFPGDPSLI
jgi:hypothetical protein